MVFVFCGLVLALVALIRSNAQSLEAWAVLLLALGALGVRVPMW